MFGAQGPDGWEPFVTDGTPAGTFQLADIAPGPGDSFAMVVDTTRRTKRPDAGGHLKALVADALHRQSRRDGPIPARTIAQLPQVRELNIGHFLIGEAIFTGLAPAIALMRKSMDEGRAAFDHRHRL